MWIIKFFARILKTLFNLTIVAVSFPDISEKYDKIISFAFVSTTALYLAPNNCWMIILGHGINLSARKALEMGVEKDYWSEETARKISKYTNCIFMITVEAMMQPTQEFLAGYVSETNAKVYGKTLSLICAKMHSSLSNEVTFSFYRNRDQANRPNVFNSVFSEYNFKFHDSFPIISSAMLMGLNIIVRDEINEIIKAATPSYLPAIPIGVLVSSMLLYSIKPNSSHSSIYTHTAFHSTKYCFGKCVLKGLKSFEFFENNRGPRYFAHDILRDAFADQVKDFQCFK